METLIRRLGQQGSQLAVGQNHQGHQALELANFSKGSLVFGKARAEWSGIWNLDREVS